MRSAVLRDQTLAGEPVDLGHGFAEARSCRLLIAGLNGFQDLLDRGAAARPQRGVVCATSFVLTCALLRGLDIGQFSLPLGYRLCAGKGPVLFEAPEIKSRAGRLSRRVGRRSKAGRFSRRAGPGARDDSADAGDARSR